MEFGQKQSCWTQTDALIWHTEIVGSGWLDPLHHNTDLFLILSETYEVANRNYSIRS